MVHRKPKLAERETSQMTPETMTVLCGKSSTEREKKPKTIPTISMFYGTLILMYSYNNKKHNRPHIYAEYGEYEVSIAFKKLIDVP